MLMVIFGAGASYDSYSSLPPRLSKRDDLWHRPPLANELFGSERHFRDVSHEYPTVQPIIPILENTGNVEEILERFRSEADQGDLRRRQQLFAVRYYLRMLIEKCENDWDRHTNGISNYKTLLDQVRDLPEVAALVTFNYDTLIERALEGFKLRPSSIDGYTSGAKFKLFKLHGSINWKQWFPNSATPSLCNFNDQPPESVMIDAAPPLDSDTVFELDGVTPRVPQTELWLFAPALAVPTVSKQTFVSPSNHLAELERIIPKVNKIVIVGWRAGEQHFLKMLKNRLPDTVHAIAACAGGEAETLLRMHEAGINVVCQRVRGPLGFTEFVVEEHILRFMSSPA
jgi:hypothetical protein